MIRVTDQELLDMTGGIVQGMSGSPVIQNGKFAGAITHVFVQDAASGYGIFAETMRKMWKKNKKIMAEKVMSKMRRKRKKQKNMKKEARKMSFSDERKCCISASFGLIS